VAIGDACETREEKAMSDDDGTKVATPQDDDDYDRDYVAKCMSCGKERPPLGWGPGSWCGNRCISNYYYAMGRDDERKKCAAELEAKARWYREHGEILLPTSRAKQMQAAADLLLGRESTT
jgi:hypothetical protein